jgi:hypothetical protein
MERAIEKSILLGPEAIPFAALAGSIIALNYLESKSATLKLLNGGKDNPIDAYLKAKDGGWAAHLVPYNSDDRK